jgi:hypothetical protein
MRGHGQFNARVRTHEESSLCDTGSLHSRAQNVLICGRVVGRRHSIQRVEVTNRGRCQSCGNKRRMKQWHVLCCRIIELELAGAVDSLLNARILPQATDCIGDVARKGVRLDLNRERKNDDPSCIVGGV